jgi:hypothetical protein
MATRAPLSPAQVIQESTRKYVGSLSAFYEWLLKLHTITSTLFPFIRNSSVLHQENKQQVLAWMQGKRSTDPLLVRM